MKNKTTTVIIGIASFAVIATLLLIVTFAGARSLSIDLEEGELIVADESASNGTALLFKSSGEASLGPQNEDENKELIFSNPATRNTIFDTNQFISTPMSDIQFGDHTKNGDLYNEKLIASQYDSLFRVKCEVSHFSYDDPIVFPNEPGKAHLHMYFGNTKANAYSTFDSLLNTGAGTCNGEELNRTAYWVPAMLDRDGNALIPWEVMVYYKNTNFKNQGNYPAIPFPDDLKIISGNAGANAPQTDITGVIEGQQSIPRISFGCGVPYSGTYTSTIPSDCGANNDSLEMRIAFPACWDEQLGDYQSNNSHVAFPEGGFWQADCPSTHPQKLSSVMYRIFYRPADYGGTTNGWFLSSDASPAGVKPAGTTSHADWYGAWNKETMDMWIKNCNNTAGVDCEIGILQRDPDISLIPRKEGYYSKQRIPASELVKLCPYKQWDGQPASVAYCR